MNRLKKITLFFLLFISGLIGLYLFKRYQSAPEIALFKEEFLNDKGQKCNLEKYNNNACIISFYASWCGDCIRELNDLNRIYTELGNVTVLCITDETIEKLNSFKAKKKYPFQFYKTEKSFSDLDIHAIPVTYIVNSNGKVVYKKVGALDWKDNSFLQYAKHLLK